MANAKWTGLALPIPAEHISQREGHAGKMLDYIDRPVVWGRLDEYAIGEWTTAYHPLPVMTSNTQEPYAMVCLLTVGEITRGGVGQGKDWKEAETDAFKRAAVHFGIGRELYGIVGEEKPVQQRASHSKPASKPSTSSRSGGGSGEKMPFGKYKGELLSTIPLEALQSTVDWCTEKDYEKFEKLIDKIQSEINSRADDNGGGDDALPF